MNDVYDRTALDGSISQLESVTANFAQRFIQDGKVRKSYIEQTRQLAQEYRARVASGALSADDAARQVQSIRNDILEAQRLRSTDIGRARAINLKKVGLSLADLTEKYARDKFGKPFTSLASNQQNLVYLEIIDSAGRQRPSVNAAAMRYTALGRALVFVSVGAAIYNIASAEDKGKAVAREGVVIGGGFAAGAAGGALAGLACGPGAPVCVTVGVFVGGALGALGADLSFGWIF
ncbi:hypothetical protein [Acidovorax sp. SUPP2825]|uniref:hypothetical protein n=1 Tax=Acidovorax sp. SUPP2825 TaxID=2920879 RepID=UPI0023DE27B5|nr:hypothetical protein [Acidovorax sp. SUPP2825]GKS97201.1 hypothetical protein AVAK2825_21720 [Acidovorax sp. SUPP2825]